MKKLTAARAMIALFVLLHVPLLLPGFFAPHDPGQQHRSAPLMPPTSMHVMDTGGRLHWPFVYAWAPDDGRTDDYVEDTTQRFTIHLLVRGPEYKLLGLLSTRVHLFGVEPPGQIYLLGTDEFGRDQFSRFVSGGQLSLFAGLLATAISLALGSLVGIISGFYGRYVDETLMRLSELFIAVPWLYLMFAARAALPLHVSATQAFALVVVAIGVVGWAKPARLIRGVVLSAKERAYVEAARGFGASDGYLLRRHILPQAKGLVLTQATLLIPRFILAEVTLSFLGLGVGEPVPSWGTMLASLQRIHVATAHWWLLIPGLALIPVFFAYNALADHLRKPTVQ